MLSWRFCSCHQMAAVWCTSHLQSNTRSLETNITVLCKETSPLKGRLIWLVPMFISAAQTNSITAGSLFKPQLVQLMSSTRAVSFALMFSVSGLQTTFVSVCQDSNADYLFTSFLYALMYTSPHTMMSEVSGKLFHTDGKGSSECTCQPLEQMCC